VDTIQARRVLGDLLGCAQRLRSVARALALRSKSAMPAIWMNSFSRLLEARDGIASGKLIRFPGDA
jgi:hypothetical protein